MPTAVKSSPSLFLKAPGKFFYHGVIITCIVASNMPDLEKSAFSRAEVQSKNHIPCAQFEADDISCTMLDRDVLRHAQCSFG